MKPTGAGRIVSWRGGSLWIGHAHEPTDFHSHHAVQIALSLRPSESVVRSARCASRREAICAESSVIAQGNTRNVTTKIKRALPQGESVLLTISARSSGAGWVENSVVSLPPARASFLSALAAAADGIRCFFMNAIA
jgi:hypothetical protein